MNELLEKETLAPKVTRYVIRAPEIARRRRAGQFVIVRLSEDGERIPLTIADADAAAGTVTLVVQEVGKSTAEMALTPVGQAILDVVGPLGSATHVEKLDYVLGVGGGIGVAPLHPICQAYRASGARVEAILGARNKDLLILEDWMRKANDAVHVCTDDGSYGEKGFVTNVLERLIGVRKPDLVVAIGPLVMMKNVAKVTQPHGIKTMVSLNPVMVDGTGMCGGCRVTVGGKTRFVCVDGPEFDAHAVDYDELLSRQRFYVEMEKQAYERFVQSHECRIRGGL
ncbi:MAG TPA: sulfide/dihydroorotate dehydrogenase-like FAD/NAD-binding protein [Polyangia bacterium]|jgi:ferredoxin--NADP+ reductase